MTTFRRKALAAVVVINVLSVAPLVSPVYLTGLTEEEVRRLWEEYHTRRADKTVTDLTPPHDF